ncbi:glycosyltransferase family 2 protein [Pectinatus frisingensis]|uniref:glycosyltransferase family 2 protein n=1 Tax=Pectinatus frisingensis TaxID=865 RepID=UPI003D80177C
MFKNNRPLVSIVCITFNQAPYFRRALDSILMQKTNFPYEIIVHDDCSTDGTTKILREYEQKFFDVIKPIYEKENLYSKHIPFEKEYIAPMIRGKYVAFCEGDDYWLDRNKLQIQADFMENHTEYSMIFHAIRYEHENEVIFTDRISKIERDYSLEELIEGGGDFAGTATFFCRSKDYSVFPEFRLKAPFGDYTLQILAGIMGKVHYIPKVMSAYTYLRNGSWTSRDIMNLTQHKKNRIDEVIMLKSLDRYTNYKYHNIILKQINLNLNLLVSKGLYTMQQLQKNEIL